jgi:hypothetical protein
VKLSGVACPGVRTLPGCLDLAPCHNGDVENIDIVIDLLEVSAPDNTEPLLINFGHSMASPSRWNLSVYRWKVPTLRMEVKNKDFVEHLGLVASSKKVKLVFFLEVDYFVAGPWGGESH